MAERSAFRKGQSSEELTERERTLVDRLLGDPSNFPATFKTWLRAWIGEDPPPADWSTIIGAPDRSTLGGGPVGSIYLWPTSTPPRQHLALDGAVVSRVTYKSIWDIFGATFGAGDGTTTFGLPDTRGRMPVGLGTHADNNAIGDNDGAAVGSRRSRHQHSGSGNTDNQGSHSHGGSTSVVGDHQHGGGAYSWGVFQGGTAGTFVDIASASNTGGGGQHQHGLNIDPNGGHFHGLSVNVGPSGMTDTPAYLTLLYIIRYA